MSAIIKFIFSKQMLIFLALVLLSLSIWFVGPLISFSGLRPLEGVGIRLVSILLLLLLTIMLLLDEQVRRIGIGSIAIIALSILIWYSGHLLDIANIKPLIEVWQRSLLISILVSIYLAYELYQFWVLLSENDEFRAKIFSPRSSNANPASNRIREVQGVVSRAISQLKQMRSTTSGFARLLEGKKYLYEMPWYMVIGKLGVGKTSAILNAGLKFPLADQLGIQGGFKQESKQLAPLVSEKKEALSDSSANLSSSTEETQTVKPIRSKYGTVNCDWWFSNEAVLIDTAGRYTQHEDNSEPLEQQANKLEWQSFLQLLRRYRTRAPINGAIVAIDMADLIESDRKTRLANAAVIRARLGDLRNDLGIRFPVYVIITKTDLLPGFVDYFSSLTSEGRAQAWGFTLPLVNDESGIGAKLSSLGNLVKTLLKKDTVTINKQSTNTSGLRQLISEEICLLCERLEDGITSRLQEEFDSNRRQALYVLPQELDNISEALSDLLEAVFMDSRFDNTQISNMLRGVFFTSTAQIKEKISADRYALTKRIMNWLSKIVNSNESNQQQIIGQRSFFLNEVLLKIIFPEKGLVRPNLGWEAKFRLLRLIGHLLVIIIGVWIASGLILSKNNNNDYLNHVNHNAKNLYAPTQSVLTSFRGKDVPDILTQTLDLPTFPGLDVREPPISFLFGLYSITPIIDATNSQYYYLQDKLLLPFIIKRMETVIIGAIRDKNATLAYDTLRAYLIMHDKEQYQSNFSDVRNWVLKDWEGTDSEITFGGQASMINHIENMFSGSRMVQSPFLRNEAVIRDARNFLSHQTPNERLYERVKESMKNDAPEEFTLARALGPQASSLFIRKSGKSIESGISGLFTYNGYHQLFKKQLSFFLRGAKEDDSWVMGMQEGLNDKKKNHKSLISEFDSALYADIRKQYLLEYSRNWEFFLSDIRIITGTTLSFDLHILKQLAAPDSPLARLGRIAVRETTLSRMISDVAPEEKSFLDKATEDFSKKQKEISRNIGLTSEERMEKQLVDNRFAALREVVTGQSDTALPTADGSTNSSKQGLAGINGVINEFYTALVIADTAINTNIIPPSTNAASTKLILEGGKMPAPFREILLAIAKNGVENIKQGAAEIFRNQAQKQLDRLLNLLSNQLTDVCKRTIEGKYPFVDSNQEVEVEDFERMFAPDGIFDEVFKKQLLPFVDTSSRPWKYKSPDVINSESEGTGTSNLAVASMNNAPTLQGEFVRLLASQGPNLDIFARVAKLREVFFRGSAIKKYSWKMNIKIQELDPNINQFILDIDGQLIHYAHGPVQYQTVWWPGTKGGVIAELTANPRISNTSSVISGSGQWGIFRLIDKALIESTAASERIRAGFVFDSRKTTLDIVTPGTANPLNRQIFKGFSCTGR